MNRIHRLGWLLLPISFLFVIITALLLHPDPAGLGTHRALGLPDCIFHFLTGLRCPSCGLTTSFTHLVHLDLRQSFYSHPLGPVIFVVYAWIAGLSFLEYWGRPTLLGSFLNGKHGAWLYGGLTLYLAIWITRLLGEIKFLHGIRGS